MKNLKDLKLRAKGMQEMALSVNVEEVKTKLDELEEERKYDRCGDGVMLTC